MLWGNDQYAEELKIAAGTHIAYTKRHEYRHYLLEREIYDFIWSKPAVLLGIILTELGKPAGERLEWLLRADIDTLVTNPNIRLEQLLPTPREDFDDIHLLTTNDIFGLNNGVFFLRVTEWSVNLLNSIIAFPYYNRGVELTNADQSAMRILLQDRETFGKHALIVPQHFFNGYRPGMLEGEISQPGALFMHFPGANKAYIKEWNAYISHGKNETWNMPFNSTAYPTQLTAFWKNQTESR
jgi:hypothetical protein